MSDYMDMNSYESDYMQILKIQGRLRALEAATFHTAPKPVRGPLTFLLTIVGVASQAVSTVNGALALIYCVVTLPGIRNALYVILAAETGSLRLPLLAIFALVAFVTASISKFTERLMFSRRA